MTQVSGAPQHPTDFLGRVKWAVNYRGWRNLGSLSGDAFNESDITYAGGLYYVFSTSPADSQTVYRTSATLEGIAAASPVSVLIGSGGTHYPTVQIHEDGTWYLAGTSSSTTTTWATSPASGPPFNFATPITPSIADAPAGQIDACLRRTTISGTHYWFMCAVSGALFNNRQLLRIYRHADSLITGINTWARLQGNNIDIFANIGVPSYASDANADPNIMFPGDGRMYCTFTGKSGTANTAAIVELQLTGTPAISGAFAIGTPIVLSTTLTDIIYMHCPDGVDRLFGWATSHGPNWACLELP